MTTQKHAALLLLICAATLSAFVTGCASAQQTTEQAQTEQGFTPIFDGQTLNGWAKVGGQATYEVIDNAIVGRVGPGGNTFLRTEQTYSNFEFRCEFKWDSLGNSGIQYRSHQRPNDEGQEVGRVYGYQFELDQTDRAWSGGLYEEGRRGWLQNLQGDENAAKRQAINYEDWNQIVIRCEGRHLQTWLNGVAITDYTDETDEALTEGFIALQVHSGGQGVMQWRNLRLMELNPEQ